MSANPWLARAKELLTRGVLVVPMLNGNELKYFHKKFKDALLSFPEYRRDKGEIELYARGGFGALANPASFHNEMVRELRLRAMLTAVPLFAAVNAEEKRNRRLEQIPDRMMYRHPTRKPMPESFHRDVSLHLVVEAKARQALLNKTSKAKKGTITIKPLNAADTVFGGWINLDPPGTSSHFFSCVPKTHNEPYSVEYKLKAVPLCPKEISGFVKVEGKDVAEYEKRKELIEVPPGHWILFPQQIIHEVRQVKKKEPYRHRLFLGWRLTKYELPMQDYRRAMHNQGVPLLPSGQHPPVFEAMLSNLKSISKWSVDTFVPSILHMHTTQGPKAGGAPKPKPKTVKRKANQEEDEPEEKSPAKKKKYIAASRQVPLIDRCMKSLREYHLPLYRPYEPEELKIFWPSREWDIPVWKGNGFDWGHVRHISLSDAPDDPPVIRPRLPIAGHPPLPQSDGNEEEGEDEDETETESESESESESEEEEEEGEGEEEEEVEAKDEKELIMARHAENKRAERREREREMAARETARIEFERSALLAQRGVEAKARELQEAKEKARRSRERKRAAFLRHVQEGEEEEPIEIRSGRNDLSLLGERRLGGINRDRRVLQAFLPSASWSK